jgi:hypothetical protein
MLNIALLLAGCSRDEECLLSEACFGRECQDPCLYRECGVNAVCSTSAHRAICRCKENHIGNPNDHCRPYECLIDPDCPTTKKCENERCVDPCQCARFADCTPRNHRGICNCIPDYTDDPYGIACTPSKNNGISIAYRRYNQYIWHFQFPNQLLKNQVVTQMVTVHPNKHVSLGNVATLVFTYTPVHPMLSAL